MARTDLGTVKVGRGKHGTMSLYSNGVVHFRCDAALHIDEEVVRRTDAELRHLAGGPYVSVLDFRDAGYADREARDYAALATEDAALATAIIFASGVGEYLLDRWIQESGPQRPVAFFADEDAAVAWASTQAAELLAR